MPTDDASESAVAARARACRKAVLAAICDVIEPWAHGTVARSTQHPSFYDFNVARVEDRPDVDVAALVAAANDALAGLGHRKLEFDFIEVAEPLRAGFEASGWKTEALVWMRHEGRPPPEANIALESVSYDLVHDLRVAWHEEDYPGLDPGRYHEQSRDVALRCGAEVLAVLEGGRAVGYAQFERTASTVEITDVFVDREHRGAGLGTALTGAAIRAAGEVRDIWIVADDEGRAKDIYARLGFRPAWRTMDFLRLPPGSG